LALVAQALLMRVVMTAVILFFLPLHRQVAVAGVVMLAQGQEKMEVLGVVRLIHLRVLERLTKALLVEVEKVMALLTIDPEEVEVQVPLVLHGTLELTPLVAVMGCHHLLQGHLYLVAVVVVGQEKLPH
jgi:hypothetical protein